MIYQKTRLWLLELLCRDKRPVETYTVKVFLEAIEDLYWISGQLLKEPSCGTGPDGILFANWDRENFHFEVEVNKGGIIDYFYRDRSTGETYYLENEIDEKTKAYLENLYE